MSSYLPKAVIAAEDRRFYSHFGVDPIGYPARRVTNFRAGHVVQGGSTITQQLAKILFLTPGAEPLPQDPRNPAGAVARAPLHQESDPRNLSEPRLSRRRHLRGRRGGAPLFRQIGGEADPVRERRDRRAAQGAEPASTRPAIATRRPARAAQVLDNMVEAGFITAAEPTAAAKRRHCARDVPAAPGGALFRRLDRRAAPRLRRLGQSRPDRRARRSTRECRPQPRRAIADILTRYGGKMARRPGRAGGDGARRRGARDGRRPRLRRRASSTARRRRSASRARPSSRSSISPGWRPGCGPPTGSSTRRSGSATGSRTINRTVPGRDDARRGAGAVDQHDRGAGRAARRHRAMSSRPPAGSASPRPWRRDASLALGTNEVNLLELVSAYAPFANGGAGSGRTASPKSATATGKIVYPPRRLRARASVVAPELAGTMNEMLAGVIGHGTGKARRSAASGRRQDRHDPGIPRRLVHRLHRRSGRRGLARQRRQHADEQGDRRLVAGRWPGAISCWRRPGHAGAAVAERPGAIRGRRRRSALDRLFGWLTGAETSPAREVAGPASVGGNRYRPGAAQLMRMPQSAANGRAARRCQLGRARCSRRSDGATRRPSSRKRDY